MSGLHSFFRAVFGWGRRVVAVGFLLGVVAFLPVNVLYQGDEEILFFDAVSSPVTELERERHDWYSQRFFGGYLFLSQLGATTFDCVAEDSPHFPYLTTVRSDYNFTQTIYSTDCDPLDATSKPVDRIHPDLVTIAYPSPGVYLASLPGFTPLGDTAVMVQAREGDYVLIHRDVLKHLGISGGESP